MKVYFPYTNFFLECRCAFNLPWHELDGASGRQGPDIRLIVPSMVIIEIERHKVKGNSRKAKRAREVSALLRKALTSKHHFTELGAANPRVVLELPPVVKLDFTHLSNLDPARPDHRIVAEYAEVLKTEPDLTLLSDDTLLTLAARSLGYEPVLIPEGWKLAPEKDDRGDEIDRLRDELKSHKQTSPDISVTFLNSNGEESKTIEAEIEEFRPSRDEIERAVASVQARFPIEEDFRRSPGAAFPWVGAPFGQRWHPPREEEIEAYKTKAYPRWLASVRETLPSLAAQLNEISHEIPFLVRIVNTGFVSASNVRLAITAYDGLMLLDNLGDDAKKKREGKLSLPSTPQPPRGRYISVVPDFVTATPIKDDFTGLVRPHLPGRKRDPNALYFVHGRPDTSGQELELTCEALTHQGASIHRWISSDNSQ
jgi:PIN domain